VSARPFQNVLIYSNCNHPTSSTKFPDITGAVFIEYANVKPIVLTLTRYSIDVYKFTERYDISLVWMAWNFGMVKKQRYVLISYTLRWIY